MTNQSFKVVLFCIATLIFSLCALPAPIEKVSDLKIELTGLRNDKGFVLVSLYNKKEGFPSDANAAIFKNKEKISGGKVSFVYRSLPEGTYAIAVLHDENSNQKMDFNFLGLPKEGYGFSQNPRLRFGPPSFASASFQHSAEQVITIVIKY